MTPKTVRDTTTLLPFLIATWPEIKRTKLKQWLRFDSVQVNGRVITRHDHPLAAGDIVDIKPTKAPPTTTPLPPGLHILHEDAAIMVIHKPVNLLTIATDTEREKTAFRILTDHLREVTRDGTARLWIVHRLDRETSGLIVLAKTEEAKLWLQENWERMDKRYIAIVEGIPTQAKGTLKSHLDETQPHRVYALDHATATTREAVTHYEVLRSGFGRTQVSLTLETGRRHQLRAQLAQAGHPIVGDTKYGAPTNPIRRIALHATHLRLIHPTTQKELIFDSPLPADMARLVPTT